ncbi:hypothetical protein P22_0617 [Propionispora sp. 2/2-37]|nr:hypothetical protein P22_0617 [Propionispora sp. 2/2-37]
MPSSNEMMTQEEIEALMSSMNHPSSEKNTEPVQAPRPDGRAADGPMSQEEIEKFLDMIADPKDAGKNAAGPVAGSTTETASAGPAGQPVSPLPDVTEEKGPASGNGEMTTETDKPPATAADAGENSAVAVPAGGNTPVQAKPAAGWFSRFFQTLSAALPFLSRSRVKKEGQASLAGVMPGSFSRSYVLALAGGVVLIMVLSLATFLGFSSYKNVSRSESPLERQLDAMGVAFTEDDFVKYAGRGDRQVVDLFLQAGMPVDSHRKSDGYTPLMAAASFGRLDMVKTLLEQGAVVNTKNSDEGTALLLAVKYNYPEVVTALLQAGANVNTRDLYGNSLTSLALIHKNRQIIDALLKAGTPGLAEELEKLRTADKAQPGSAGKASEAAIAPEYLLDSGRAGYAGIGKTVESLYLNYDRSLVVFEAENRDGIPYPVVKVFANDRKAPAMILSVSISRQGQRQAIDGIRVYDERFQTRDGIGIGSTLGDMRKAGVLNGIKQIDQSLYAVAQEAGLLFELEVSLANMPDKWFQTGDMSTLPDGMKIHGVLLQ